MGVAAALPSTKEFEKNEQFSFDLNGTGKILSLIFPAEQCNLDCKWCFIKGRKESPKNSKVLSVFDYLSFVNEFSKKSSVDLLSLQGYEPLLENCWEYTRSILEFSNRQNLLLSLTTNGVNLEKYAPHLLNHPQLKLISVSVDSAEAKFHNAIRGKHAFERTLSSLKAASKNPEILNKLSVISVLQPGKEGYLREMPKLLSSLGIKEWVINPLINIGSKNFGSKIIYSNFDEAVLELSNLAAEENIKFIVDDELQSLPNSSASQFYRQLNNPNRLIRLSPNGWLSAGKDILSDSPSQIWSPQQMPISRLLKESHLI